MNIEIVWDATQKQVVCLVRNTLLVDVELLHVEIGGTVEIAKHLEGPLNALLPMRLRLGEVYEKTVPLENSENAMGTITARAKFRRAIKSPMPGDVVGGPQARPLTIEPGNPLQVGHAKYFPGNAPLEEYTDRIEVSINPEGKSTNR